MPKKTTYGDQNITKTETGRIDFSKIRQILQAPYLLRELIDSYSLFLQADIPPQQRKKVGLQKVFLESFPVIDPYGKYELDFVEYEIGRPTYSIEECKIWNMSYVAPLRVRFILKVFDEEGGEFRFKESIEGATYMGDVPIMTDNGGFVINGAERVIVTQLHRSPGVFFDKTQHPNGTILFTARIIPSTGAWIEFRFDIKDAIQIYFGNKQKASAATVLRSFGYSSADMIDMFYDVESFDLKNMTNVERAKQSYLAEDVINVETGEILAQVGSVITPEKYDMLRMAGVESVKAVYFDEPREVPVLFNCIAADPTDSKETAIREIVNTIRPGDVIEDSEVDTALDEYLFNTRRVNLDDVGRFKINLRLNLDIPIENTALCPTDFVEVLKTMLMMRNGKEDVDDIDHLGLRRSKTVGELVEHQVHVAIARMIRTVKERMRLKESEELTPQKLVNARTINAALNSFFGSSQLSQFMDQVNPLAELTHKRSLSALGPGGLTRERAGFEVRDVHYTHIMVVCVLLRLRRTKHRSLSHLYRLMQE
jgi:DNA-directed RNA polymerase subunit beta